MNIHAEKLQLLQMILEIDNSDTLKRIKKFVTKEQTDFWDELHDEVKEGVEKALIELEEGKGIPHEEVYKEYSQWLKK